MAWQWYDRCHTGAARRAASLASMLTRFAIDEDLCIGCGLCRETAPENIGETETRLSRVVRQPRTRDEESRCQEASDCCPMGTLAPVTDDIAEPVPQSTALLEASAG